MSSVRGYSRLGSGSRVIGGLRCPQESVDFGVQGNQGSGSVRADRSANRVFEFYIFWNDKFIFQNTPASHCQQELEE